MKWRSFLLPVVICGILICAGACFFIWLVVIAPHTTPPSYMSIRETKGMDQISLDGHNICTTPILDSAVSSGEHTLSFSKKDPHGLYTNIQKTLFFASGINNDISITLGPSIYYSAYSMLLSSQTPHTQGITLSPDNELGSFSITIDGHMYTTGSFVNLSSGTHTVTVSGEGYISQTSSVQITSGYSIDYLFHLSRNPL